MEAKSRELALPIKDLVLFMSAQAAAEQAGKREFICPLCGGAAGWGRSGYNGHLRVRCRSCGFRILE